MRYAEARGGRPIMALVRFGLVGFGGRATRERVQRVLLLVAFFFAGWGAWLAAQTPRNLLIRYIGNEGFLISANGSAVLIDALHAAEGTYMGPRRVDLRTIQAAQAPFDRVQHLLFSHRHYDHFEAAMAASYLRLHRHVGLTSSPQVAEPVRKQLGVANQVRAVLPQENALVSFEAGSARVTAYRIRHSGARNRQIQNLVHVIEIGGRRVAHLGDADMDVALFEHYLDREEPVDVALVPYWFYGSEAGREIITKVLRPAEVIGMHVSVPDLVRIRKQFAEKVPNAQLAAVRGTEWLF